MKKILVIIVLLAGMVSICSVSTSDILDTERFMHVDELKRGMKGYGLTVFAGTQVDTFYVEILGVLKGIAPKSDLIMATLSGGPLENTGIFGGMSGSPIYIDGRLIGAAAYGWLFAKDPIAGITPIGEMLDIWDIPSSSEETSGSMGFLDVHDGDSYMVQDIPVPGTLFEETDSPSSETFIRQWSAPVALAGFDERIIEQMAPVFEQYGLTPVQGGSAMGTGVPPHIGPGSTVGLQLLRGDASINIVGTVTHREGDRILAFGHPVFRAGNISLPMTAGDVVTVFPSAQRSFKMTTATEPVGLFTQDRRPGTAGVLGESIGLIPCRVEVNSGDGRPAEQYEFELVASRQFTPNLVGWVVSNSIVATERLLGVASVKLETRIDIDSYPPLALTNFFTGDMSWLRASADAAAPFSILYNNPYEPVMINGIEMKIHADESLRSASIESAHIDRMAVRPGDDLTLSIVVKPHQEPAHTRKIVLPIPDDTPEGMVTVIVADAKTTIGFERTRAPNTFRPKTIDQLLTKLQGLERNNEIIAMAFKPSHGIVVDGEELPSLPSSLISVMSSARTKGESGPTKGQMLIKKRFETDYFIAGSKALQIKVDRNAPK